MMGRLYEQAGERVKAQASMDAAVKAAPSDLKTRLAVSQWALEAGELAAAREHAQAALSIDPILEAQHLLLVADQRDFQVAEDYFQAVLIQTPSNLAASNNLALALSFQDDERQEASRLGIRSTECRATSARGGSILHLGLDPVSARSEPCGSRAGVADGG